MSTAAGTAASTAAPSSAPKPIDIVRKALVERIVSAVQTVYGVDVSSLSEEIATKGLGRVELAGRMAFPTFTIAKFLKKMKPEEQVAIARDLAAAIRASPKIDELLLGVEAEKHFVNMFLSTRVLASVIPVALDGSFLAPLPKEGKDKVMIEYSQPNTHKAFHVGHMRNAALGDSLVRLYEISGHSVTAANYFGDEGAHIAKCLWYLQKHVAETKLDLKSIPEERRGEFLGEMYSKAVDQLDLSAFTSLPYPGVIGAKVVSVGPHPDPTAPPNWHRVIVQIDASDASKTAEVICGGTGYKVGDVVAYTPVGGKVKDKDVVPKDMKGVSSCGVIMGLKELDIEEEDPKKKEDQKKKDDEKKAKDEADAKAKVEKKKKEDDKKKARADDMKSKPALTPEEKKKAAEDKKKAADEKKAAEDKKKADAAAAAATTPTASAAPEAGKKKDKKKAGDAATPTAAASDKKADKPAADAKDTKAGGDAKDGKKEKASVQANNKIFVLPAGTPIGIPLPEAGRFPNISIPANVPLAAEITKRNKEVGAMLLAMETGEKAISALWAETKAWSLAEFKKIYAWLDCRFDHDFFESEVGEESKKMVTEYTEKKILVPDNGAIVADLKKYKLGVCVLLKSNGAGLYATKDLALAKRKFDQFKIDRSIYIVDAAQTLHFQQVFKTLELFGYEKAQKCLHLPYGLVVLPSGKMSSRKGTVILFSQLTKMLNDQIDADYLAHQRGKLSDAELSSIRHAIAVATIKFGMLNHDRMADIVFNMAEWTAHGGMNGPYMLYAYARTRSIVQKETAAADAKVDLSLLSHPLERSTLTMMHNFWPTVASCLAKNNASGLCEYVYDLAKAYSSWYDNEECSVKHAKTQDLKRTRLEFINAFAAVVKKALYLLGIKTVERM